MSKMSKMSKMSLRLPESLHERVQWAGQTDPGVAAHPWP